MPPLPKKRQTKEADITPKILKWFEQNYPHSAAIEIKIEKNKLQSHQILSLQKVVNGSFVHKIRDTGLNPYDAYLLVKAHAVIVRYYPKEKKCIAERLNDSHIFEFYP